MRAGISAAVALLGSLLISTLALAGPASHRVVVLSHDGVAGSLETSFADALRIHLTELELRLELRPAPASTNPFEVVAHLQDPNDWSDTVLVAWIVPQKPRIILYIYEPRGPRLRARAVSVSGSSLAASEELSLILHSAILARREGGELEMAEVALPAAASPAPALRRSPASTPSAPVDRGSTRTEQPAVVPTHDDVPQPSNSAPRKRVGVGMGVSYLRERVLDVDEGGGLQLRAFGQTGRSRFGLGYVVVAASQLRTELTVAAVYQHPIQLFVAQAFVTGRVRLQGELTTTADPMLRRTRWADAPLEARNPQWRWGWSVGAALRGEWRLLSGFWLSGAVGGAVALNPFSYEQVWAQDRRTSARVLPVRPVLDIGLVWVTQ